MAAHPTIEIVIRDDVTVAMERLRNKMRSEGGRDWFKGLDNSLNAIGRSARRLHNELGGLVRLTGAGVFLGGGFVAGLTKLTESLGNLSRQTLQMNATAASIGLTVKQFDTLIARGQAVGLSAEQSKAQIGGLAKIIDELAVKGPKAARFAEIYKSFGGPEFLAYVRRATQRGGTEGGIEAYIRGMSRVVDRRGRSFVGDFAGMSPVWTKALSVDEKALVESLHVPEEQAQKLNLELLKLQITLENVKKTAAISVLPAMTELVTAFDKFASGPGAAVVKQFGEWLASLNIDWKSVTEGIVSITEALTKFFQGLDPIVQQMGGWKIIIGGLVGASVLGLLVGRLASVGAGLLLIGNAAWVVPVLGMAAFGPGGGSAAGGAAGVKGAPGGPAGATVRGPGGGRTAPTPTPAPAPAPAPAPGGGAAPYGRDRRGRAYPAPQGEQRSDLDPENAAPYRVAGGWQPPPGYLRAGDTSELRDTVSEVTANVTRLAQNVAALGLNTDASGAGPMAGVAGRVTSGGPPRTSSGSPRRASTGGPPRTSGPRTSAPPRPARVTDTKVSAADDEFRIGQGPLPSEAQLRDKSVPAGRRNNNPFNMWHDKYADEQGGVPGRKLTPYDTPAVFPSGQAGAAAVVRKMIESPLYRNKTMWDLIYKWVSHGTPGGYAPWIEQQTGIPVNTKITREFLMSDDGLKFLKAMARYETKSSEEYPLTDEQWRAARDAGARVKRGQQVPPANPNVSPADPKVSPANPQPNTAGADAGKSRVRQSQSQVARDRTGGVDPHLEAILDEAAIAAGVATVNVTSGGQRMPGARGATGSHRHDKGFAADHDLYDDQGKMLSRNDPRRLKYLEEIVALGGGGIGVGYMKGVPLKIHAGITGDRGIVGVGLRLYNAGRATREEAAAIDRGFARYYAARPELGAALKRAQERRAGGGEKKRQEQAQRDFDEYLQKQRDSEATQPASFSTRARAGRLKVNINLRGPRGVKGVVSDSSGGVSTTINREMDPTGGGAIQSPG